MAILIACRLAAALRDDLIPEARGTLVALALLLTGGGAITLAARGDGAASAPRIALASAGCGTAFLAFALAVRGPDAATTAGGAAAAAAAVTLAAAWAGADWAARWRVRAGQAAGVLLASAGLVLLPAALRLA